MNFAGDDGASLHRLLDFDSQMIDLLNDNVSLGLLLLTLAILSREIRFGSSSREGVPELAGLSGKYK